MNEDTDLADLQAIAFDSLRRFGLMNAEAIAAHLVADLRRQFAGDSLYFNRGFTARNQQIRQQFNGRNAAKLAAQFGLSRRRVEQILSEE